MSTTEPTTPRPATNAGAEALRYAWLESISQSRFGTERTNRISRELADLIVKAEQEAGRLAVAEALSVERIAENLTSLFQQAFPTTDRDETAYLIDSWIWAEGAAALRAALMSESTETPRKAHAARGDGNAAPCYCADPEALWYSEEATR
jgi:hypothetical protein